MFCQMLTLAQASLFYLFNILQTDLNNVCKTLGSHAAF